MKWHNLKPFVVFLPLLFFAMAPLGFSQTDAQHFAEGRLAFDKYKDCPAAEKALQSVSAQFRKNPAWIMYMARTEECEKQFASALNFYQQYDTLIPGNSEVLNKIGDLSYQMHKGEVQKIQQELEGTWVAVSPAAKDSFGIVRCLTIVANGDALSGTYREADFNQGSETVGADYTLGTLSLQRSGQVISLSWKTAAYRQSFESSDKDIYPQNSAGSLSNAQLTLRLQWSANNWQTITFVKSTSSEGISTINAALKIIDSFVYEAKSIAESDREDAQDRRHQAQEDLAESRHFENQGGREAESYARDYRDHASDENKDADRATNSASESAAAANQASNYKGNWTSLLQ